jgi:hypothetical protein
MNAPTMFKAAQRIGRTIRDIQNAEGKALEAADIDHDVAFLFGGQIKGERLRLFMIYSAGNFIECTTDTPYLQIGEHKYGKPVLDRAISYDTDLYDGLKIGQASRIFKTCANAGPERCAPLISPYRARPTAARLENLTRRGHTGCGFQRLYLWLTAPRDLPFPGASHLTGRLKRKPIASFLP